jgi:class 3 adenylate cyclase
MQRGAAGAEELAQMLNGYFGQLIDLITDHGGEVIDFAGDALIALWPARNKNLAEIAHCAAQCGLAIQTKLNNYEATDGVRLALKVSIGAGPVLTKQVGGLYDRWEFLLTGEPFLQLGVAEKQAQPGSVLWPYRQRCATHICDHWRHD